MSNWHERAVAWLLNPKKSLLWVMLAFVLCCWWLGHQAAKAVAAGRGPGGCAYTVPKEDAK